MNSLQLKFLMRGPHNETCFVEATLDPEKGKSLIVRSCNPKTFELSSVIDSEVFGAYYALALLEISKMTESTFLPSHMPHEYLNAKVRIDNETI